MLFCGFELLFMCINKEQLFYCFLTCYEQHLFQSMYLILKSSLFYTSSGKKVQSISVKGSPYKSFKRYFSLQKINYDKLRFELGVCLITPINAKKKIFVYQCFKFPYESLEVWHCHYSQGSSRCCEVCQLSLVFLLQYKCIRIRYRPPHNHLKQSSD